MNDLLVCEICHGESISEVMEYDINTGNRTDKRHCFCLSHITEGIRRYSNTFKYNRWDNWD